MSTMDTCQHLCDFFFIFSSSSQLCCNSRGTIYLIRHHRVLCHILPHEKNGHCHRLTVPRHGRNSPYFDCSLFLCLCRSHNSHDPVCQHLFLSSFYPFLQRSHSHHIQNYHRVILLVRIQNILCRNRPCHKYPCRRHNKSQ